MKNNITAFKSVVDRQVKASTANESKAELLRLEKQINLLLKKNKSLFSKLNRLLLEDYHSQMSIDFYNEGYLSAIAYIKQCIGRPFIFNRVVSELFSMYYAHLFSGTGGGSMENSLLLANSRESFYAFCSSFKGKDKMQKRYTEIQLLYNEISFILGGKSPVLHEYITTHRKVYSIDEEMLFFEGYLSYLKRLFEITFYKLS